MVSRHHDDSLFVREIFVVPPEIFSVPRGHPLAEVDRDRVHPRELQVAILAPLVGGDMRDLGILREGDEFTPAEPLPLDPGILMM